MSANEPFPTASYRIAVLDDNPASRLLVERILRRHLGCQVELCDSPEMLHARCGETPPDLFLIDIVLGDRSGIDVCRELKSSPKTRDVPVIFFSTYDQPRTRIEALRAGGVDYIDKPFYPEEFLQRVRGCIERFRHQRTLEIQTQEQQALLRVLCHDLRNSVGAALGVLQLMQDPPPGSDHQDHVKISLGAVRSALDLIGHVAEYRTLLDESRPFKLEPVLVSEACAESLNVLGTFAADKGIHLRVDVPESLGLVTNRVVLVHNILNNLVSNAVKFSRAGDTVWISAALAAGPEGPECVLIIRDEGIGIPPSILQKLGGRQPVCSRPGTAQETGTGLGLNLVHLYTQRCGGRVSIESQVAVPARPELKSGTCVTVRLPLQPAVATPLVSTEIKPAA